MYTGGVRGAKRRAWSEVENGESAEERKKEREEGRKGKLVNVLLFFYFEAGNANV